MLSRNFNKILLSATAFSLLTSCAVIDKKDTPHESNWFVQLFEKDGQNYADNATLAYSNGNFEKALTYTTEALKDNPRNQQALLVGALASEKLGRYNRARQYYEDLIIINGDETSVLGSSNGQPQKLKEIAKNNLRAITIAQSNLTIEDRDGVKHFSISDDASEEISKKTIINALNKETIAAKEEKTT
jgi:tetratricopeptide (TPR) repeat protein